MDYLTVKGAGEMRYIALKTYFGSNQERKSVVDSE